MYKFRNLSNDFLFFSKHLHLNEAAFLDVSIVAYGTELTVLLNYRYIYHHFILHSNHPIVHFVHHCRFCY